MFDRTVSVNFIHFNRKEALLNYRFGQLAVSMALAKKQDDSELLVAEYDVRSCMLYNSGDVISRSVEIVIPEKNQKHAKMIMPKFRSRDSERRSTKKAKFGVAVVIAMLSVMIVIVILCWVFPATSIQTNSNITEPFSTLHVVNKTVINSTQPNILYVQQNTSYHLKIP